MSFRKKKKKLDDDDFMEMDELRRKIEELRLRLFHEPEPGPGPLSYVEGLNYTSMIREGHETKGYRLSAVKNVSVAVGVHANGTKCPKNWVIV